MTGLLLCKFASLKAASLNPAIPDFWVEEYANPASPLLRYFPGKFSIWSPVKDFAKAVQTRSHAGLGHSQRLIRPAWMLKVKALAYTRRFEENTQGFSFQQPVGILHKESLYPRFTDGPPDIWVITR